MGERDPRYPLRGREALLEHVVGLCHTGGGGKLIVLHGLGGSGKTAVALEAIFAHPGVLPRVPENRVVDRCAA